MGAVCSCCKERSEEYAPDGLSLGVNPIRDIEMAVNDYTSQRAPPVTSSTSNTYDEITETLVSSIAMPTTRHMEARKYSLVVAIDFGTSSSGYAYSHVQDGKTDITLNENWSIGGASHYKTPTCLCVAAGNPKQIHSFGFDAQNDFLSDEDEMKDLKLKLFEEFKMQLYNTSEVNHDMRLCAKGDETFSIPSLDVFAMAIKFLKDKCLKRIREAGIDVANDEIMWVLTVPAIWKDKQKWFMRQAATQAGLINNMADRNLMIALESEAAGLYCRSEYTDKRFGTNILKKGSQFMVIDAGGGTVDITAYESVDEWRCKELISPVGGAFAGKAVDENFLDLLKNLLGEDIFQRLSSEYQSNLLEVVRFFEVAKNKCDADLSQPLTFSLGYVPTLLKEYMGVSIFEACNKTKSNIKVTKTGRISIPPETVKELFEPVVARLVSLVQMVVQKPELETLTTIFLVGGFSQCAYLEHQLKQCITDVRQNVCVLKPKDPVLSVVKGAVICGNNPKLIQSRVAPATYLIEADSNGEVFYSPLVKKGEHVPHGEVKEKYAEPASSAQACVNMKLFATDKKPPYRKNDPELKEVCNVRIRCDGLDTMCFEFLFGATEIEITGKNFKTGEKVTTSIDFL